MYNQCAEHELECELGPSKSISCMECCKAKAKCKQPGEEKLERKCKEVQTEKLEVWPSGSKKLEKMLEESNMMVELVEVLKGGLKAITDVFNK